MRPVLIPLPSRDFDPTEVGVPWQALRGAGFDVVFATPDGQPGEADPRMVTGAGLGIWRPLLQADRHGRDAYAALVVAPEFRAPIRYDDVDVDAFGALVLPGGHAKGMRPYLESPRLQSVVATFFATNRPVAAICHGTLLAGRSVDPTTGRSVLWGRRTTGLLKSQEMAAFQLTRLWLGDYYRTYDTPLETELRGYLRDPSDFDAGPLPMRRDAPDDYGPGFTVRDGDYLSARWPGDAHRFAHDLLDLLNRR